MTKKTLNKKKVPSTKGIPPPFFIGDESMASWVEAWPASQAELTAEVRGLLAEHREARPEPIWGCGIDALALAIFHLWV